MNYLTLIPQDYAVKCIKNNINPYTGVSMDVPGTMKPRDNTILYTRVYNMDNYEDTIGNKWTVHYFTANEIAVTGYGIERPDAIKFTSETAKTWIEILNNLDVAEFTRRVKPRRIVHKLPKLGLTCLS